MKNQTQREARRLQWSDLVPCDFGQNYVRRLGEIRNEIGQKKYDAEVRGVYTKVAFVGLALYNSAVMTAPIWINGIVKGLESLAK